VTLDARPAMTADPLGIGGGINRCGIVRDAAGRGPSITLAEMGDLGRATFAASTRLFRGGPRWLEFFGFRLFRDPIEGRKTLPVAMPHISWPMRHRLPPGCAATFRPVCRS